MDDCGCTPPRTETAAQRRVLQIALALNAAMFAVEVTAGVLGSSSGLIADGLDMLADASAYAVALLAIGRGGAFRAKAATASGVLLLALGIAVLADVARRAISGGHPEGWVMIGVAAVALGVNATVLRLLAGVRDQGVHLRATWIFTRADVIANAAVIASGVAVLLTGFRHIDLAVGAAIGLYVIREAVEIIREARQARGRAAGR